ncbi:MAG: rhodanese-like domain-containing protein [Chitinophagaceae bacterium]|jgi:rhodanese-related sulfurtransferase|nr:rhodanese-like domain-containing protein [Chitinophagaceae bacterium]MCU0403307.1 rhodanese-like domain-containing protein [Chitinophagaceae bacterium]
MKKNHIIFSFLAILVSSFTFLHCSVTKVDGIKRLDNEQFRNLMNREGYVILDVRTPKEYDSARIEGSVLMNVLDTTTFYTKINELDPNKKYLLYCRTGKRSMTAAKALKQKGFRQVYDLQNGIKGWDGPTISGKKE